MVTGPDTLLVSKSKKHIQDYQEKFKKTQLQGTKAVALPSFINSSFSTVKRSRIQASVDCQNLVLDITDYGDLDDGKVTQLFVVVGSMGLTKINPSAVGSVA